MAVPNADSVSWRHPPIATKSKQRKTPLEPARAGAQDGSTADNMVIDLGMETTTDKESTAHGTSTTAIGHKLQVCICGWNKVTSAMGLKIHQGRKRCLREQRQGPRIDRYFLRGNESNQSSEAQRRDANQSSQSISTPAPEEGNTGTEMSVEEPTQPQIPPMERKIEGHKPSVKWPKSVDQKEWETINRVVICLTLPTTRQISCECSPPIGTRDCFNISSCVFRISCFTL